MREIKFRVFTYTPSRGYFMQYSGENLAGFFSEFEGDVIMQYTGLKDKNGVEIYEGDVLQSQDNYHECHGKCSVSVAWDNERNGWNFASLVIDSYSMEVIGNIHENPELLEEKK